MTFGPYQVQLGGMHLKKNRMKIAALPYPPSSLLSCRLGLLLARGNDLEWGKRMAP